MKRIKHIMVLAAGTMFLAGTVSAQSKEYGPYGYIPNFSALGVSRLHDLSTQRFNLGTARSAAMGGAFTSLGADLSAMHINPAGLGMYLRSEFGVTIGPSITDVTNSMRGMRSTKDSRTAFAINSMGAVFNVFEGSRAVTSFSFGIGYTRLADYNYNSTVSISGAPGSILDMYSRQMGYYTGAGGTLEGDGPFDGGRNSAYLNEWGAILAYKTFLLDPRDDGTYYSPGLGGDAYIEKKLHTRSKGSAGEFAFSGGWNFGNKVYFGLTFGMVTQYQDREATYSEDYSDNYVDNDDPAAYMDYRQRMRTEGEGYNFKAGLIVRPVDELRIGVAFHSPTFMTVKNFYNSRMDSEYVYEDENGDIGHWATSPEDEVFTDKFMTPARLMAGASYTVAGRAIVSADYERAFYTGIRMRGEDYDALNQDGITYAEEYEVMVKQHFTGSNTLRLGAEVLATDMLAVRLGYVYSQQGLKSAYTKGNRDFTVPDLPVEYRSDVISAGLGFNLADNTSFDLTYSLADSRYSDYDLYRMPGDMFGQDNTNYPGNAASDFTRQKQRRHSVMLSLNYRF